MSARAPAVVAAPVTLRQRPELLPTIVPAAGGGGVLLPPVVPLIWLKILEYA
jgi:hypothetical protein